MTYRVLITGSRTWQDVDLIHGVLNLLLQELGSFTLVHGACPRGADAIADQWGRMAPDVKIERHPAEWHCYGKRAGFVRNKTMASLGADVCLAFIRDNSRGATHCADMAEREGIEVRRWVA